MGVVFGCGLGSAVLVCCQVDQTESYHSAQMTDPSREEEHVSLLGEEGLRAGGQLSLKLGYDFASKFETIFFLHISTYITVAMW